MSHFIFQIRKIEVGQDKGKPLFVEEVEICAADQEPVVFPLSSWVDDTEKDYLPGERQIIAPVTQSIMLMVKVYTRTLYLHIYTDIHPLLH